MTDASYRFPVDKLVPCSPGKKPVVLVNCGSFNPVTFMHLRIMEVAKAFVLSQDPTVDIIGGYLSPVADAYGKAGLIGAQHRLEMTKVAVKSSSWLMCADWEALQPEYHRTFYVLKYIQDSLPPGTEVRLVMGADVFLSMQMTKVGENGESIPVWKLDTLLQLLENFPVVVLNRDGGIHELDKVFAMTLQDKQKGVTVEFAKYRNTILIMTPTERNDLSSTYVRNNILKGYSNKYLLPDEVIEYISANQLYRKPRDDKLSPL